MCDCRSYNRPEWGGSTDEIVVTVPKRLQAPGRETVCLDLCIAPSVLALWAAGIKTFGSCCGHNGAVPRTIIVDDVESAQTALPFGETARLIKLGDTL